MSAGKRALLFQRMQIRGQTFFPTTGRGLGICTNKPAQPRPAHLPVITGPTSSYPIISEKVQDEEGPAINY